MVKAITYILVNDTAFAALVGRNDANDTVKVYPNISTQSEGSPLVTVWKTGRKPEFCKGQRPTTFDYTYEVHVYSDDYDKNQEILQAAINALENQDTSSAINGVTFNGGIRNTDSFDKGYIEVYKLYDTVGIFEATVNEDQAT